MKSKNLHDSSQEEQVQEGLNIGDDADSAPQEIPVEEVKDKKVKNTKLSKPKKKKETAAEQTAKEPFTDIQLSADKENATPKEELPQSVDYSNFGTSELIDKLKELLDLEFVPEQEGIAEEIKVDFYRKHEIEIAEAKQKFIDEGGNPDDYKYNGDSEKQLKSLLKKFQKKKTEHNKNLPKKEAEINTESATTELETGENLSEAKDGEGVEKEEDSPKVDHAVLGKEELVEHLNKLLETRSVPELKGIVEEIKVNFYKKHKIDAAEAERNFVKEGGNPEDFEFRDDSEIQLKALLQKFREKKTEYNRNLEKEKETNLQIKFRIIEEIKNLINRKESINKTFQEFRELQKEWRDTGLVPQQDVKNLWETYHHHVENFYDYININKELRDLDLKKNYEQKIRLCEEAEKLLLEPSAVKAFNTLQKFHEQWREIGPVPREKKDELWNRFKESTSTINKKHQEFYENLRAEQKKNLEAKIVLCEKAEEIASRNLASPKDWSSSSREILELQKVWRTIGFAPKKENNKIYSRFRTACDLYFDRKRDYYLIHKEELNNNLQLKNDLCVQAESLQNSTEWKKTTNELIAIQKKWKEIGPVPRKVSEELWNRFRSACDIFFTNKSKHFKGIDSDQEANLKLKDELIETVMNFQPSDNNESNIEQLHKFQKRWAEIGYVPFKHKDRVQKEFRRAINQHFDRLNLDVFHKETQRFKNKIESYLEMSHSEDKILVERNKIANKIKQLENDITLWENNIGFFSKSKNSESVIKDIQQKIEKGKKTLELLKEKLVIIDNLSS